MQVNLTNRELLITVKSLKKLLKINLKKLALLDNELQLSIKENRAEVPKLKIIRYEKSIQLDDLQNLIQKFENLLF